MKASDLRIGNYYTSVKFGVVVKCDISDLSDLCAKSDGAIDHPPIDEMFAPIPLTEDWLNDFGFKNDYAKHWTKSIGKYYSEGQLIISYSFSREDKEAFQVSQGTGGDNCTWIYPPKPKYVHELQTLYYALTGKELVHSV